MAVLFVMDAGAGAPSLGIAGIGGFMEIIP